MTVALVLIGWYLVCAVAAFCALGLDKRRAQMQRWRLRERTLHTLSLLGGWPGSVIGMKVFKHKRRKRQFVIVEWAIVLLHILTWGLVIWFTNWISLDRDQLAGMDSVWYGIRLDLGSRSLPGCCMFGLPTR